MSLQCKLIFFTHINMIRKATIKDAKSIAHIYNYYIKTSVATFAENPLNEQEMIVNINKSIFWFVYIIDTEIVGYAYASKWKERSAYSKSVEISVYLKPDFLGNGIGSALYSKLLDELKKLKIHAVIGGISLPNKASQQLHTKFGFEKVAHFKEVGFKFNKWIDVGYWELILK